jgi:cyclic pyranopterin phosphate synthase
MRLPVIDIPTPAPRPPRLAGQPVADTGPRSIGAVRMLRVSLTDRCNFRCVYCMPAGGVEWLPARDLLSDDEVLEVAKAAASVHNIRRFKLTGGEPTLRPGLAGLVRSLRREIDGLEDLSMTTNGFLLEKLAAPLRDAGLDRVTVSVDSLRPDRFHRITRTGDLAVVVRGLEQAEALGFDSLKINCVVMRGVNDDEVADFARLTLDRRVTVRFIEYMPLGDAAVAPGDATTSAEPDASETGPAGGCGAQDRGDVFVPEPEVRRSIEAELGPLVPVDRALETGVGPAVVYRLARGDDRGDVRGRVGFISAMSAPFCATCNRLRLTATGVLRSCLFEGGEVDLKPILRGGGDVARRERLLGQAMVDCVRLKPEVHGARGAEQMSRIGG